MSRRLPDIVELFSRRFREARTVITHPFAVARRVVGKRARSTYENAELPGNQDHRQSRTDGPATASGPDRALNGFNQRPSPPPGSVLPANGQGPASQNDHLTAPSANQSSDDEQHQDAAHVNQYLPTIPLLSVGTILKGSQWYRYQIGEPIRNFPGIRWYHATNQADETVIIQEYLLPNTEFHQTDIQERQKAFVRLINLNINTLNGPGEGRDFRLLRLVEAFSPAASYETARCYLVAKPLAGISLRAHLQQYGYFKAPEIREALRQVLQTLQFLHTVCRIQFSTTPMERGIPHGNLSLDSLFIRQTALAGVNRDRQFFIHVADLLLWEHLIYPPSSLKFHSAIAQSAEDLGDMTQDLKDLGRLGFWLAGASEDSDPEAMVELRDEPAKSCLNDTPLYSFLCRLIGADTPFTTADEALQALRDLPMGSLTSPQPFEDEPAVETSDWQSRQLARWGIPAAAIGLFLVGMAAWLIGRNLNHFAPITDMVSEGRQPDQLQEDMYLSAAPSPTGTVRYQVELGGVWQEVLWREFSQSELAQSAGVSSANPNALLPLMAEIEHRHRQLRWGNSSQSRFQSRKDILQFVSQSPQNVGLIRLPETSEDASARSLENLEKTIIAYDGLAILVPFRDSYNDAGNMPEQLDGHISLEEIQNLYTSDDLESAELRGVPVNLYFPQESELVNRDTIQVFKEQVLKNNPDLIHRFDALRQQATVRDRALIREYDLNHDTKLNNNLYEKMLFIYEAEGMSESLIIGFDRLSRSFGQCSVFPLAIGGNAQASIQPIMQVDNQPIQADIDLCDASSRYHVNLTEQYPLRYELAVVYQQDSQVGETVGAIFSTQEAQYLLSEVGLVPTIPMPELWDFVWGQNQANE